MTHICISNLTIIGSYNGILFIGPSLGTNSSEILIKIHTFSFKKMHLKMLSAKWPLFCLGLNMLIPMCHNASKYWILQLPQYVCLRCQPPYALTSEPLHFPLVSFSHTWAQRPCHTAIWLRQHKVPDWSLNLLGLRKTYCYFQKITFQFFP